MSKVEQLKSAIFGLSQDEQQELFSSLQTGHVDVKDHDVNTCKLCMNQRLKDMLSYYMDIRYFCQGCLMPANEQWNAQECTKCENRFHYCDACVELNCSKLFDEDSYGSGTSSVDRMLWTEWDGQEYYKEFTQEFVSVTCGSCAIGSSDKKLTVASGGSPRNATRFSV